MPQRWHTRVRNLTETLFTRHTDIKYRASLTWDHNQINVSAADLTLAEMKKHYEEQRITQCADLIKYFIPKIEIYYTFSHA